MAFNPWNTNEFTPLGLINLARKNVYDASAAHRGAVCETQGSLNADHRHHPFVGLFLFPIGK